MKKTIAIAVIIFTVQFLFLQHTYAEIGDRETTLKGIKEFKLFVGLNYNKTIGLPEPSKEIIKKDIELQLRLAWVKVLKKAEALNSTPTLVVDINLLPLDQEQTVIYLVNLGVSQMVGLERKPDITLLTYTWNNILYGIAPMTYLEQRIREGVKSLVDSFLNDYFSVNPKQLL